MPDDLGPELTALAAEVQRRDLGQPRARGSGRVAGRPASRRRHWGRRRLAQVAPNPANTELPRAMGAAKQPFIRLHAVTDDAAATAFADGRHRMDRAFKAIEGQRVPVEPHLETSIIFVTTSRALSHELVLLMS